MSATETATIFAQKLTDKFNSGHFEVISGRRYDKIVHAADHPTINSRSVYAFMDRATGDLYKAQSWSSPAKGVRYKGDVVLTRAVDEADIYGSFLYRNI